MNEMQERKTNLLAGRVIVVVSVFACLAICFWSGYPFPGGRTPVVSPGAGGAIAQAIAIGIISLILLAISATTLTLLFLFSCPSRFYAIPTFLMLAWLFIFMGIFIYN